MKPSKYFLAAATLLFFVFAFSSHADTLGQSQPFSISPQYDAQSRTGITATLRKISSRAYFYVEDAYWNNVNQDMRNQLTNGINALAQEFDDRIYPTEKQFFGDEPSPGVDGDNRITILLTPIVENAGGYFDTANEFPKSQAPLSNEREMIYLNISALQDLRRADSFLAHEFQHAITFNQKDVLRGVSDDTWLNELRSEYAVTLMGYNDNFSDSDLERRLNAFLSNPSDGLTEWKNTSADYGQITMFGEYIAEHWSPQVFADTLKNNLTGIASLNDALSRNGFKESFYDVFTDWLIADVLNNISKDSRFGYTRDSLKNFQVTPTKILANLSDNITLAVSDSIKDWQCKWYEISQFAPGQNDILRINFSSPSLTSFLIPYIVVKSDGSQIFDSFSPAFNSSILYIDGAGKDVSKIILMPLKKDKISGFGSAEPAINFSFSVDRIKTVPPAALTSPIPSPAGRRSQQADVINANTVKIPDGSLIRGENSAEVYVIQGRWRRHIISPKIFRFYPQFGFDKVKVVSDSVLSRYADSNLVRSPSSRRIYSVDENNGRHWLNMSGNQFSASGRDWSSVFMVNSAELNFYPPGPAIRK